MFTTEEWLLESWDAYNERLGKRKPTLADFTKVAQDTLERLLQIDLRLFEEQYWQDLFASIDLDEDSYDDGLLTDGAGWPLAIYERSFYKPLIKIAVEQGMFDGSLHRAIVYMHLFDRYYKRGEFLSQIVMTCLWPEPVIDQSMLAGFFAERLLEKQPQLQLL